MTHPTIGILTANPIELAPILTLMDDLQEHTVTGDSGVYHLGYLQAPKGRHRVVIAVLTKMGNNASSAASVNLARTFPSVTDIIFCGIAGGIPRPDDPSRHVRLGDIVVSSGHGVLQFDYGAITAAGFEIRDTSPPPSALLQQAARNLEAKRQSNAFDWPGFFQERIERSKHSRPRESKSFRHPKFAARDTGVPYVHFGPIGSSNAKIKDDSTRDRLIREKILAIEMEGSGLADATWHQKVGYLIVRGICDYADRTTNDRWQPYAAWCAAIYVAALMRHLPLSEHADANPTSDPETVTVTSRTPSRTSTAIAPGIGELNALTADGMWEDVYEAIDRCWSDIRSWDTLVLFLRAADHLGRVNPTLARYETMSAGLLRSTDPHLIAAENFYVGRLRGQNGWIEQGISRHRLNVRDASAGFFQFKSWFEIGQLQFRIENFEASHSEFTGLMTALAHQPATRELDCVRTDVLKFLGTLEMLPLIFDPPFAPDFGRQADADRCLLYTAEGESLARRHDYTDGCGWAILVHAFALEGKGQHDAADAKYREAKECLQPVAARRSSYVYALIYHAAFHRRRGNYGEADKLLSGATQYIPQGTRNGPRAQLYEQRAQVAKEDGKDALALTFMKEALEYYELDESFSNMREWPKVRRLQTVKQRWKVT